MQDISLQHETDHDHLFVLSLQLICHLILFTIYADNQFKKLHKYYFFAFFDASVIQDISTHDNVRLMKVIISCILNSNTTGIDI